MQWANVYLNNRYVKIISICFLLGISSLILIFNYSTREIRFDSFGSIVLGITAGVVIFYLLILISKLLKLIKKTNRKLSISRIKNSLGSTSNKTESLILTVGYIISAAIVEELLFRSIVLDKIIVETNMILGIISSSILFALIHFNHKLIQLTTSGIIYCILVIWTNNLLPAILAHITSNIMIVIYFKYSLLKNEK